MNQEQTRKTLEFSGENVSGRDAEGSSLMPMLIAGLIMIAIGYFAVMIFV